MGNQESPPQLEYAKITRELMEVAESLPTDKARASVYRAAALYLMTGRSDVLLSERAKLVFDSFLPNLKRMRDGAITGRRGGNPNLVKRDGEPDED